MHLPVQGGNREGHKHLLDFRADTLVKKKISYLTFLFNNDLSLYEWLPTWGIGPYQWVNNFEVSHIAQVIFFLVKPWIVLGCVWLRRLSG